MSTRPILTRVAIMARDTGIETVVAAGVSPLNLHSLNTSGGGESDKFWFWFSIN